jgi:hypothetical protein
MLTLHVYEHVICPHAECLWKVSEVSVCLLHCCLDVCNQLLCAELYGSRVFLLSGRELLWQLVRKHMCGHAFRNIRVTVHLCKTWHYVLQNASLLEGS